MDSGEALLSVIIPTLNEENNIVPCIRSVGNEEAGCEIILSDGGSTDGTIERAGAFKGVRVVNSARGRGLQMNKGAAEARGEVFLFLHADTRLEEGWSRAVRSLLSDSSVVGGAFTFRVASDKRRYRLTEFLVSLRCGIFKLPYGDQGIFVRREIFEDLGGFREFPLMEDVDMISRMRKKGRIGILGKKAFTHHRRWETEGWICASLQNQLIMVLFRLGLSPETLARMYYRGR